MKSCDDCPSSVHCSGHNLHPVLVRVCDLYRSGVTDKFDILFALSSADEDVLERYTVNVSRDCWSKAALLAIVEVVGRLGGEDIAPQDVPARVHEVLSGARHAFSRFPWNVDALVEQAPDLYALIQEQCPDENLCAAFSKRAFVKMCKDIVFA